MLQWIKNQDYRFHAYLVSHRLSPGLTKTLRFYTRLGDGYVWAIVLVYLLASFSWDSVWHLIWRALLSGGLSLALYWIVKLTVRRPRPFAIMESVKAEVPPLDKFSFPSGHVMNNIAPGLVIFLIAPQIGWLVVLMPITWGVLRVYFGVHWLSDIIAGTLLGALCAVASLYWLSPLIG